MLQFQNMFKTLYCKPHFWMITDNLQKPWTFNQSSSILNPFWIFINSVAYLLCGQMGHGIHDSPTYYNHMCMATSILNQLKTPFWLCPKGRYIFHLCRIWASQIKLCLDLRINFWMGSSWDLAVLARLLFSSNSFCSQIS
jgi:hypothetical protein